MRIRKFLVEATATGVSQNGKYTEIMKTPFSSQDLSDLKKLGQLRFIVDASTDTVYLFDADLLHYRAAAELGLQYQVIESSKDVKPIIYGQCFWNDKENKTEYLDSFNLEGAFHAARFSKSWRKIMKIYTSPNYDFAEKYIKGIKKTIERMKNEINKLEAKQ